MYIIILINIFIHIYIWRLVCQWSRRPGFNPRLSHTKDSKNGTWCHFVLTLSIIRYGSRVKGSNLGKGVAPSPTRRCSSYWKRSLSGHPQLQLPTVLFYIYKYTNEYIMVFMIIKFVCLQTCILRPDILTYHNSYIYVYIHTYAYTWNRQWLKYMCVSVRERVCIGIKIILI